jgi:RNA polymerase sigma-70 factor (ECF subfamily)
MTDEQRLASALAADLDRHFEDLVRSYQDRLYGFALRLLGSPSDAEEAIQDTFVRAYRALQRYPSERVATLRLKAWLYQIALNVVRNRVRRPELVAVSVDSANALTSEPADEPERQALAAESQAALARKLRDLPDRYATAVVLRHIQGLSYAEAAQVLDQPVGTTKSDVHRGLRLLREAIEEER